MKIKCDKHGEVEATYIRESTVVCPKCYSAAITKNYKPLEELPRCGCGSCEVCGETIWIYKDKVGCGNVDCEKYNMHEVQKLYEDNLKELEEKINDR